jgi:hypothetical protein
MNPCPHPKITSASVEKSIYNRMVNHIDTLVSRRGFAIRVKTASPHDDPAIMFQNSSPSNNVILVEECGL